jgi:hypothetical protein
MAKKLVGHAECPECGFADAEIGEDKGGNLYRFCPDCNAQYFTRGREGALANLRKQMRPVKVEPAKPAAPATVAAPKKRGALDELLGHK